MAPLREEEDKPLDTPEHAEYSALQTAKGIVGLIVVFLMALVAAYGSK